MKIVLMNKTTFSNANYVNVTNIAYNASTKVYVITYGENQTTQYSGNDWDLFILAM